MGKWHCAMKKNRCQNPLALSVEMHAVFSVKRSTIHETVNELPTRKMHVSRDIFLDYIEIVYICTHIGIESASGEGFQLATRMRQAQNLELHCRDARRTVVSIAEKSGQSW
jgi:hypothetical protein